MSIIVSDVARCNECGEEFHYADHAWNCPHAPITMYDCHKCGQPMVEQVDPIAHVKTGHLWRCETPDCMPPDLVISIG